MRAFAAVACILIGLVLLGLGVGSEPWLMAAGAAFAVVGFVLARPFRNR